MRFYYYNLQQKNIKLLRAKAIENKNSKFVLCIIEHDAMCIYIRIMMCVFVIITFLPPTILFDKIFFEFLLLLKNEVFFGNWFFLRNYILLLLKFFLILSSSTNNFERMLTFIGIIVSNNASTQSQKLL